ncbi:uncharacterized protein LOC113376738 [Ctenocephalides felis]|uniref:uncharacterized protein LOC113376738 n=2 Tax=Ctenocephalides felis TaxID=7515 RepID=UPI000E6E59C2|nr:uncharacterized protein LOC113376738 [Ctenocephalides felis]
MDFDILRCCCITFVLSAWVTPASFSSFETNAGSSIYVDKIGLEQSIAAVLHKVAYGSTTTKRSIPDGMSATGSGVTTVTTPLLTTFRYRERDHDLERPHEPPNGPAGFELDLEKDHALPTSAPNADILKSHGSSSYPNPNRHHNGDRGTGHQKHNPLGNMDGPSRKLAVPPTQWMYSRDVPSYAPPSRSYNTPPLPPDYFQFADKPTLRNSNSEGILGSNGGVSTSYASRRPLPPPSLMPNHERIPVRPPNLASGVLAPDAMPPQEPSTEGRKKTLNTPYNRATQIDTSHNQLPVNGPDVGRVDPNGNLTDFMPNGSFLHYPSISRILSGSNGRKEEIPAVLLRTVTAGPSIILPPLSSPAPPEDKIHESWNIPKESERKLVEAELLPSDVDDSKSQLDDANNIKNQDTTDQVFPMEYSTEIIQLANVNNDRNLYSSTSRPSERGPYSPPYTTWTVAWNLHIYLVAILFTILAVYSIFKIICYDKLTHLFSQSYFVCLHLTLILICLARIFYLCYDPYNIHSSFHIFISEILLNLPAAFLTVSFAILILFLLRRTINLKNNRYSALVRPLTVIIGSSVHVGLCITLHYVESHSHGHGNNQEPRILGLICQIIYIFVCLSLGLLYLYIYRILKRILRNKSQNYIHGYQNLSYAIHISIATALLFILLAALQVYGVVDMTTSPRLALSEFDWLQWGYQFSLRLIEVAVITLMSWVAGLRTGSSKSLQREKGMEPHNVSGFALFPCTSSSSQEHFETDYPAICNANTNLHTYTLRTGKPIYDDSFALNSLGTEVPTAPQSRPIDYQMSVGPDTGRSIETDSACSSAHNGNLLVQNEFTSVPKDYLNNSSAVPDHYENPDFEFRGTPRNTTPIPSNCYSEPVDMKEHGHYNHSVQNLDFKNFERPHFDKPASRTEFRASKNMKNVKNGCGVQHSERDYEQSAHNVYGSGRHSSFDRRGVRKSGTMSNIGGVHTSGIRSSGGSRSSGVQTLSSSRAERERSSTRSKKHHAVPDHHMYDEEYKIDPGYPERPQFDRRQHSRMSDQKAEQDAEINESMLVAEHGFVRFRALDAVPPISVQRASKGKEKRYNT